MTSTAFDAVTSSDFFFGLKEINIIYGCTQLTQLPQKLANMRSTIAARDLFALAESHPTPCHPVSHNIQNLTNIGMSVNRQMWEKVNNIMVVGPIRNDDI